MPRPRERHGRFAFVRQQERVAHLLGLDEDTHRSYVRKGVLPGPDPRGWWCVPEQFEALAEHVGGFSRGGPRDPVAEAKRLEDLREKRLKNDAREGRLVAVDEDYRWWEDHVLRALREAVLQLARRWGPEAGDVIRDVLARQEEALEKAPGRNGDRDAS